MHSIFTWDQAPRRNGIRSARVCFCIDISNLLPRFIRWSALYTNIQSPDKKLHALLHPFLFIIHGGKSWKSAIPDAAMRCISKAHFLSPSRSPPTEGVPRTAAFLRRNSTLIKKIGAGYNRVRSRETEVELLGTNNYKWALSCCSKGWIINFSFLTSLLLLLFQNTAERMNVGPVGRPASFVTSNVVYNYFIKWQQFILLNPIAHW